jgi:hypothetical protein
LIVALGLALSISIVPALGDTVQDQSSTHAAVWVDGGRLLGKGVAVDVTVEYQCIPGVYVYDISVDLRQRFGRDIAHGYGYVPWNEIECSGLDARAADVRIDAYETPFKAGKAFVTVRMYGYDQWFGYFEIVHEEEIRLTKNR